MFKKKSRPAKSSSGQQAFTWNGNNYQAGGNIHINTGPDKKSSDKSKWLGTTQSVITIISLTIGTGVTLFFTIPKETRQRSDNPAFLVSGIIRAKTTHKIIPNAFVTSDLNHDTVPVTSDGTFQFEVHDLPGKAIRIYAWSDHYALRNEFHTLGLPIEIELDKK